MVASVSAIKYFTYYNTTVCSMFRCNGISAIAKSILQNLANLFILLLNGGIAVINFVARPFQRKAPEIKQEVESKSESKGSPTLTIIVDPPTNVTIEPMEPTPAPTPSAPFRSQSAPPNAVEPGQSCIPPIIDTKHKEGSPITPARSVPPAPASPVQSSKPPTPPQAPRKVPSPRAGEEAEIIEAPQPTPKPTPVQSQRTIQPPAESGGCVIA